MSSNPFSDPDPSVSPKSTLLPFLLTPTESPTTVTDVIPKPWLSTRQTPRLILSRFLPHTLMLLGLSLGILQCYLTYHNVKTNLMDNKPLCLILHENFSSNSESTIFSPTGPFFREVNMNGYGNGEFEMTTSSSKNSYIKNSKLYIAPTLTSEEIGVDNVFGNNGAYIYNISGCTFNLTSPNSGYIPNPNNPGGNLIFDYSGYYTSCSATSNSTSGSIINPVQSARISTLLNTQSPNSSSSGGSIRYGRIEIRAKLPTGDWLWPAIWLLPTNSTYGPWPRSGEIDILESRGNSPLYTAHGSNYIQGSLNWGPSPSLNGVSQSYSFWSSKRTSFGEDFHTYVLEWTEGFLRIYVDTRLHTLLEYVFDEPFFERGVRDLGWPEEFFNSTTGEVEVLEDPWVDENGNPRASLFGKGGKPKRWSAPFDQEFYLIMNVAVGGTNGWFPESQGNKPWLDNGANAMRDFANAQDQWYPTWPQNLDDRAMVIDDIKMWKHCDGN